jgi:hypothetical protein
MNRLFRYGFVLFLLVPNLANAQQQSYPLNPFSCPVGQFVYGFNPVTIGLPGWFCSTPAGSGGGGGNGITALTGPVTAMGPGSVPSTITPTGVTSGVCSNPSSITVNAAGQVTNIVCGGGGGGSSALLVGGDSSSVLLIGGD